MMVLLRPKYVGVSVTQSIQALNDIFTDGNLHFISYK
jgi:hypothetical protein